MCAAGPPALYGLPAGMSGVIPMPLPRTGSSAPRRVFGQAGVVAVNVGRTGNDGITQLLPG